MDALKEALGLDARRNVYNIIKDSPGLHFREVQRRSDIAVGNLQYHLEYLQKRHLVRTEKDGKFVRFYTIRENSLKEDSKLMGILRKDTMRKIILFLLKKKKANNVSIAKELQLSPSSISWQLKKLIKDEIIEKKSKGRENIFYLKDEKRISEMLLKFKKSFLDTMVDNFASLWDELEI